MKNLMAAFRKAAFFIFFTIVFYSGFGAEVKIKEYLEVDSDKVLIKDIVTTDDSDFLNKYGEKIVIQAPKNGRQIDILPNYLKTKMKQLGLDNQTLIFPKKITIKRIEYKKAGKLLYNEIYKILKESYSDDTIEFEIKSSVGDEVLPSENFVVEIKDERIIKKEIGNFTIFCDIISEDKILKRVSVNIDVGIRKSVFVLSDKVLRGERFSKLKIKEKEIISSGKEDYITKEELTEYEKKIYKISLKEDTVLKKSDFAGLRIIKQNSKVKILIENDGMSLNFIGRAMEDGYLGETIKVMNESSKKILIGTVLEIGNVKIDIE